MANDEFRKALEDAIQKVPLVISSTRRDGENGIRNADEIVAAIMPIIKVYKNDK